MKPTKIRFRKCKVCEEKYEVDPYKPFIGWCSADCGYKYQQILKEKKVKKEVKDMREALKSHKDYIKLFQIVFNTFIRMRDKDLPCVSCGVYKCEEFHAGHYIASTYQYLRFNENNVHKQCSKCNTHLRGNSIPYRIELIKRIGLEEVEYLENSRHMMLEITIPELKEKIIEYKLKTKKLNEKESN